MDPQNPTQNGSTPVTPTPTTEPVQTPGTPTSDPVIAGSDGQPAAGTIDLSAYFKDGEAGVFDPEKITALVKDRDNKAKSASYFQSQYMTKNDVPETVDGYAEHFKPDSTYEGAMDKPEVQKFIQGIREMALKEGISPKAVNAFIDWELKQAVAENRIDLRTDEQKQADQEKINAQEKTKLEPFLASMHRTFEQQHDEIKKFFDAPSIFTNDTEVRDLLMAVASDSAVGFRAISMIMDHMENGGYKSLPTQSTTVGIGTAEFWNKFNAESDPVKREALMAEFERINGPIQQ